jgi:hypothetical protein
MANLVLSFSIRLCGVHREGFTVHLTKAMGNFNLLGVLCNDTVSCWICVALVVGEWVGSIDGMTLTWDSLIVRRTTCSTGALSTTNPMRTDVWINSLVLYCIALYCTAMYCTAMHHCRKRLDYIFNYALQPLRLVVRYGLDVPTFATRRLHACHHAREPSGGRWNCEQEMSDNFA